MADNLLEPFYRNAGPLTPGPSGPAVPENLMVPSYDSAGVQQPAGGLAPEERGGLSKFMGNVGRGFNLVMSHPAYARVWNGVVGGMTGDPGAGPRILRAMNPPMSMRDELDAMKISAMKDREARESDERKRREGALAIAGDAMRPLEERQGALAGIGDWQGYNALAPPAGQQPKAFTVGRDTKYGRFNPETNSVDFVEGVGGPKTSGVTVNTGEQPFASVLAAQRAYADQAAPFLGIARGLDVARGQHPLGTTQSDIDMISAIAKAIDPTSVVREGEILMRLEFQPLAQQLTRKWQMLRGGSGVLTPEGRKEIIDALEAELRSRAILQRDVERQFSEIARHYDVPQSFVIPATVDQLLDRAFQSPKVLSADEAKALGFPE